MNSFYAEIQIKRKTEDRKERTIFYIVKDELFGLRVENYEEEELKEKYEYRNISNQEKDVEKIIDLIIEKNKDISQIEYFIEDCLIKQ